MNKNILKIVFLFFVKLVANHSYSQAPYWDWAKSAMNIANGNTFFDEGRSIAVDPSGYVYITGAFEGSIVFGNTQLFSSGLKDVFLVKYDMNGNVVWAKKFGGSGSDEGRGVAFDTSGNLYMTGNFTGNIIFGNTTLTSAGSSDIFIVRYDVVNENVLWAARGGGSSADLVNDIAVYADRVTITGSFKSTATFGNTTLTSAGGSDIFVASYTSLNVFIWAKSAGGSSDDQGIGIAAKGTDVYVTGNFQQNATFGNFTLSSSGSSDIFIVKCDLYSGNFLGALRFGGTSGDGGYDIAIDAVNNIYVTGYFFGTVSFGNTTLTSAGNTDVFVAKFTTINASSVIAWARRAGGASLDSGYGIGVDASNNVYVMGTFASDITFGNQAFNTAGVADIFLAKYNTSGSIQWGITAGGSSTDRGWQIAVSSNYVYLTGSFLSNCSFGNIALSNNAGGTDIFISKICNSISMNLSSSSGTDNQTVCNNNPIANITYNTNGATGIGNPIGLPPGVSASFSSNTITINGTPTLAGIYNYTIPLIGYCSNNSTSATGTITVNTNNTASTASSSPIVCLNSTIPTVTHSTSLGTTGIGTPTGLPPGVQAVWNSNIITISGSASAIGTYNYSIPLTGGFCNTNATGTIKVNANSSISLASTLGTDNQAVCIGNSIANIVYNTSVASGAIYTGLPSGVVGLFNTGTITISGTPVDSGTFNYTITLTGGCGNVFSTGTISVDPCLSIEEHDKTSFTVFPNPSQGLFTIQSAQQGIFELLEASGKIITNYKIENEQQIISEVLPPGLYFLHEKISGKSIKLYIE